VRNRCRPGLWACTKGLQAVGNGAHLASMMPRLNAHTAGTRAAPLRVAAVHEADTGSALRPERADDGRRQDSRGAVPRWHVCDCLFDARRELSLDKSIIKGPHVKEIWYDPRYGVSCLIHQSDQWGNPDVQTADQQTRQRLDFPAGRYGGRLPVARPSTETGSNSLGSPIFGLLRLLRRTNRQRYLPTPLGVRQERNPPRFQNQVQRNRAAIASPQRIVASCERGHIHRPIGVRDLNI